MEFLSVLFIIIIIIIVSIVRYYTYYPSTIIKVDITSKRNVDNYKILSIYISGYGTTYLKEHLNKIEQWKNKRISSYKMNQNKINNFLIRCEKNCNKAFVFKAYRTQTRYKQINYRKFPYQVEMLYNEFKMNDKQISSILEKRPN